MLPYDDTKFDPAAPLALVALRGAQNSAVIHNVPMLLDTGADVSLLPRSHAAPLVATDAKEYELEAFDGARSFSPAVTAELRFLDKSFRGQFLLTDGWHGVLGRNILNNLKLLFDGPNRTWTEHR